MPSLPAAGTFRLYPFAEPPVPAGEYVLTGDVSGLPGQVEQMRAAVHITAPRYTMPPDQILSTFPPAGSTGAFGTRLPQSARILVGPGDDAAVISAPDGRVVASTDVLVDGRHFRRDWSSAYDVGRRAAAANRPATSPIAALST